ncbi:MAG: nucleotide sugar dehydrogenase [Rhizobiaceae bacterium]
MIPDFREFEAKTKTICVVGLGYVGMPLAVRLATKFKVIGCDINQSRVEELKSGVDHTGEVDTDVLQASGAEFTADGSAIADCQLVIVTVPTPIDGNRRPDLRPILDASKMVGRNLAPGAVIVYESTVYPGVTEDECVPILEKESGKTWKTDFWVGYSPERINPGDKVHTLDKITKVVAGDTEKTAQLLERVYGSVIPAGIHVAESIQVAEAAKVIENTQRDLNIALMNELALIFNRLDINTHAVLRAAGTKWNFLPFTPGLVGGHCIGVDPYYLTHKAESVGYHPEVILSGRRINDGVGKFVAEQTLKKLVQASKSIRDAKVLILGFTFKENVPDLRNTRVIDIVRELEDYQIDLTIHDPHASVKQAQEEYSIELTADFESDGPYDSIILAVPHDEYRELLDLQKVIQLSNGKPILIDIKWLFDPKETTAAGMTHWQL